MAKKKGLGRGLDSLIPQEMTDRAQVLPLDVNEIRPNPFQPRKDFPAASMESLKESIETHGLIQPILVRKGVDGYEIVAGERRYRAARMARLEKIPAIVVDAREYEQAQFALIENLQREDLNAVEEAQGLRALMDEHDMTQEELARSVSKSRSYVANALRLLGLPDDVLDLLKRGAITAGHARTLLMFDEPRRLEMAQMTMEKELTVRELEKMAKKRPVSTSVRSKKDIHIRDMERQLEETLGTKVRLRDSDVRKSIEISFYSRKEMDDFLEMLLNVSRETNGKKK